MKWLKRIFISISIIGALFVAVGAGFSWYVFSDIQGRDHVTDQVLISDLRKNKNKYEKLISMFREDAPASVIHPTWMSPDNVITAARWDEYKKLFLELGLDAGMRSWGGDSICFISTAQGLVTGGSSKGYMFKPENPKPLYMSLDNIPDDLESNVMGYRKINDEWYIVFDWDD
jgi:hypothetical protein